MSGNWWCISHEGLWEKATQTTTLEILVCCLSTSSFGSSFYGVLLANLRVWYLWLCRALVYSEGKVWGDLPENRFHTLLERGLRETEEQRDSWLFCTAIESGSDTTLAIISNLKHSLALQADAGRRNSITVMPLGPPSAQSRYPHDGLAFSVQRWAG